MKRFAEFSAMTIFHDEDSHEANRFGNYVHEEVYSYGFEAHIRSRREENVEKQDGLHPARRWVVERTFAWLKGFCGIRTRYFLYLSTLIAFVKLACAIIVFRRSCAQQQSCWMSY